MGFGNYLLSSSTSLLHCQRLLTKKNRSYSKECANKKTSVSVLMKLYDKL